MPMFGYQCPMCKTEFETIVKSDERDNPQECPKCEFEYCAREAFPSKPPLGIVNGASAANNYGLKPNKNR